MTPERWQQIDKLVAEALELEASRRRDFLAKACAGDDSLRREVKSLIAAHERAEGRDFLEVAAVANYAELFVSEQSQKTVSGNRDSPRQRRPGYHSTRISDPANLPRSKFAEPATDCPLHRSNLAGIR